MGTENTWYNFITSGVEARGAAKIKNKEHNYCIQALIHTSSTWLDRLVHAGAKAA